MNTRDDAQAIVDRREVIVRKWCDENHKDFATLSMDDILKIRALPDWKNAANARSSSFGTPKTTEEK